MSLLPSPVFRERIDSCVLLDEDMADQENVAPKHDFDFDFTNVDLENQENIVPEPEFTAATTFEAGGEIYVDPDVRNESPASMNGMMFEDLSLGERPARPLEVLSSQAFVQGSRVSMVVVPKGIFSITFPIIFPNEVIVTFYRGYGLMKASLPRLCVESRVFHDLLSGPDLPPTQTRMLVLRGNFMPAVYAMLAFVETGTYEQTADISMSFYPTFTIFDLHVYAYIIGSKYELPRLCAYAVDQYVGVALAVMNIELDAGFVHGDVNANGSVVNNIDALDTGLINRFLDSIVQVWKRTPATPDNVLRGAVLELVKMNLVGLSGLNYFGTLMRDLGGFGDAVLASLEEDGMEAVMEMGGEGGVRFG